MSVANGYDTVAEDAQHRPTKLGAEAVLEPIVKRAMVFVVPAKNRLATCGSRSVPRHGSV